MSKLSASARKALSTNQFALPGKRAFPIQDEDHGRAALSMAHNASPSEQATIKAKVHAKFPDIGRPGKRVAGKG